MVAGAPPIDEVLPRFVEFSRDSVLVAHNARFDLGFLDYELGMLQRQTFPRPALDTLRLARKLCPQQRCSLALSAERFDTQVKPVAPGPARRPGHGRAAAHLPRPAAGAGREHARRGGALLRAGGAAQLPQDRRSPRSCRPRPASTSCATRSGAALYIGKAENLRRRTRDHFLQSQAYGARQALELLERFDDHRDRLRVRRAAARTRLIAKHRPPYNAHGTRVSSYHYVKLSADEYPRLYATPNLRDDGSLYAGPFRRASFARRFAECLNGAYPLRTCARLPATAGAAQARPRRPRLPAGRHRRLPGALQPALNGEYAAAVDEVRRVLEGHGDDLDERLQERQDEMVRALAFEQAARLQKQRETLERALRTVRRLRAARRDDAVMAYPAWRAGWVALLGVPAARIVAGAHGAAARPSVRTPRAASSPSSPRPRRRRRPCRRPHRRDAARALLAAAPPRGGQRPRPARPRRRPADTRRGGAALVGRVRLCAGAPYSSSALPRPRRSKSTTTTAATTTATATTT